MSKFNELGYEYIPNILSTDTCAVLSAQFILMRDNVMNHYNVSKNEYFANDELITNSYSVYGSLFSEPLLEILKPKIEEITGKKLYSSFSYARVYYTNGEMGPHIDRPSCEYALTITISHDGTPWNIYLEDYNKIRVCVTLDVGCGILYHGSKIPHWREPYTGKEQVQFMLFWVDADGEFSDFKYDKRKLLGSRKLLESM